MAHTAIEVTFVANLAARAAPSLPYPAAVRSRNHSAGKTPDGTEPG
jgi:hypothetical protein